MTHILHRAANAVMPVAVGGKGIELFDRNGKGYIDASGGAAVSCLGHGHPDILAALHKQLDTLAYAHTGFFTTEIAEKLADQALKGLSQRRVRNVTLVLIKLARREKTTGRDQCSVQLVYNGGLADSGIAGKGWPWASTFCKVGK